MSKKNRTKLQVEVPARQEPELVAAPALQKAKAPVAQPVDDGMGWLDDLPAVGLGILCMAIPRVVEPGIRDLFQFPKQVLLANGAAVMVGLLGVLALFGRPLKWPRTPLVWPGLVFIGAVLLSMVVAPEQTGGMLSIFARYDLHRWLAAAVLFGVTLVTVSAPRRLWSLALGLTVGGLLVSFIGIGEHHDIKGLLPEAWRQGKVAIISKPGSTFGNRNMAAQLIVGVIPACYAVLWLAMRWWTQGKASRALAAAVPAGLALAVQLYYLKLTVTRSALIGVALGLVVSATAVLLGKVLAERRREKLASEEAAQHPEASRPPARSRLVPLLVALGIGGTAVVGASYFLVKAGFQTPIDEGDAKRAKGLMDLAKSSFDTKSDAARWRFGMWESTWEAIKAEPLGFGAGNWRVVYPQYVTQREKNEMFSIAKQPIRAHQDFLQVASEYGVHGILALLALIGLAFWLTARAVAHADDPGHKDQDGAKWMAYFSAASLAAILAICGDALFSFPLQLPAPTFLFALHLGIIGAVEARLTLRGGAEGWAPKRVPQGVAVGLTGAALAGMVFLNGFGDYQGLHDRWTLAEKGFTEGRALQKRGRPSEGLTAIRQAIAINPDDFQNHFIEALCLNSLGQTKDAITSLKRSLALYPNLLNAWVNVAMFSVRVGDEKGMMEAIDIALKLKPDELVAHNTRASWLNQRGRHAEVLQHLQPQFQGYTKYRASGNWPEDDGGQLLGAYKQMLNHLITAAKATQKWDLAATYLIALDKEPIPNDGRSQDAKRKEWLGRAAQIADALGKAGQWQEALPWYKKAAEQADKEPEHKANYGLALARLGQFETAGHEIRLAIRKGYGRQLMVDGLREIEKAGAQPKDSIDKLVSLAEGQQ